MCLEGRKRRDIRVLKVVRFFELSIKFYFTMYIYIYICFREEEDNAFRRVRLKDRIKCRCIRVSRVDPGAVERTRNFGPVRVETG